MVLCSMHHNLTDIAYLIALLKMIECNVNVVEFAVYLQTSLLVVILEYRNRGS